ncbi:uncharacterized protein LOC108670001 [Hyalella azteca]|uniref:Uncharacterized protein LOC108670001 n=1 Tax=Hyalella azteca TaxID=294128 RepID=A0A8B7NH29_HYAAZ|nr:uncharacterized protein LOC108670001 [Hyalella azteca]
MRFISNIIVLASVACLCFTSPAAASDNGTDFLAEGRTFSLFKIGELQADVRIPDSFAELIQLYVLKPILFTFKELVTKFPYDALDAIHSHRYFRPENLKALTARDISIRKAFFSVFSVPQKELVILDNFFTQYVEGAFAYARKHLAMLVHVLRQFVSVNYKSLDWMKPIGTHDNTL